MRTVGGATRVSVPSAGVLTCRGSGSLIFTAHDSVKMNLGEGKSTMLRLDNATIQAKRPIQYDHSIAQITKSLPGFTRPLTGNRVDGSRSLNYQLSVQ